MLLYVFFLLLPWQLLSQPDNWDMSGRRNLDNKLDQYARLSTRSLPKNIVLFVGSGLGTTTLTFGMHYKAEKMHKTGRYAEEPLVFDTFGSTGIVRTASLRSYTTTAAEGMTAILTGRKVDEKRCDQDIYEENILTLAYRKQRKEVGLVTHSSTPASIFIPACSRGGADTEFPAKRFKVLLGGDRNDSKRILEKEGSDLKKKTKDSRLVEMTEEAISALETRNEKGYFLVVHSARVAKALAENKARLAGEELLEWEETVKRARQLTSRKETLIVATADCSHAIMMPGYLLKNQSLFTGPKDVSRRQRTSSVGVIFLAGPGGSQSAVYSTEEARDREFVSPAIYKTKSGNNGADDVPIYADGPGGWLFTGVLENTEIAARLEYLLCLDGRRCDEAVRNRDRSGEMETKKVWILYMTVSVILLFLVGLLLSRCTKMRRKEHEKNEEEQRK